MPMSPFGRALRGVALVVVALVGLAGVGLLALSRREPHAAGLTVTGTMEARDVDLWPKTKPGMPADAVIATDYRRGDE
jgi:hypothetical protein